MVEDKKSKKKPGCFIHLVQRIGRTIRHLTRRLRKRSNVVSPIPHDAEKILPPVEEIGKKRIVNVEEVTENGEEIKNDIVKREDLNDERTEDENNVTNEKEGDSGQNVEELDVNGSEVNKKEKEDEDEDLEEFAEGYVKINLEKISSMFVAKELKDGEDVSEAGTETEN